MARATMTREALVAKLATVFREHGFEGASLARLSEATGLVKASLYYQFPRGKDDMAATVLAATSAEIARDVIGPLRDETLPARARFERMCEGLDGFYAGGRRSCVVDVFGIGPSGTAFGAQLRAAISGLCGAIAAVLEAERVPAAEAARRAQDAVIAVQGSLVVSRATGETTPFRRVLAELPDRLLEPAHHRGQAGPR